MPPTFLLVLSLLALAAIPPGVLAISISLCFSGRLRYVGRQMLIYGFVVMLVFGVAFALLVTIFASTPNEPRRTLFAVLAGGFSMGALARMAWAALRRLRSNYALRRTRSSV